MIKPLKIPVLMVDLTTSEQTAYDTELDAVLDARGLEDQGHIVKVYERARTGTRSISRRVIYPVLSAWCLE